MNLFLLQAPTNSVLGTKIVLNKQSDLILHGAEIVAPTGIVEADIDGLVNHFTQIEQAISDSGSELNSGIDKEASIRLEADQSLAADLSAEKGRIDVILDGSTVDLDQFKEVVDFVQSIDLENDESLLNAVVNINQNIDNVITDFQSSDNDILDQLSTLTIYTEEQVNIVSSGLEQEIIDRADAVQFVQNDLNQYKDYTDTTIINLQNNIGMGDESLATSLSSEESLRILGDESLQKLFTDSLDQNYSQLSSDISAEVLRATTAEESLANTIANVISNVDPVALDSLSEIVDAFVSADGDLNGAIKDLAKDLAEQLKSESNSRAEADKSLEDGLAAEIADREKQAKDIEVRLTSEITRAEEADKSLEDGLAAEKAAREKQAKDIEVRLTSEIKRAEEAEASLEVALSTEVSYLVANTDFSKLDSFSETIDATNKVISTTYDSAVEYVVSNRPTMVGFTSSPDGTTTSFDSSVELGTHIVFLNGLMQLEGVDFTVQSVSGGTRVTFASAPFTGDAINIYGVPSGTQEDPFRPIDFVNQPQS